MACESTKADLEEGLELLRQEQAQVRAEREAVITILALINRDDDVQDLIRSVSWFLRNWSGCEAVGIRMQVGEDYPYVENRGFSAEHVALENSLCAVDEDGMLVRDSKGNPVLECMCGNVLCGRYDPSLPFFTSKGSFWTNSTTELLASITEEDRQARTRNRCHGEGYESVLLIPLRHKGKTFGLLQCNDSRRDMFTPELVDMLEHLADSLSIGLAQRREMQELREWEESFRLLFENAPLPYQSLDHTGCFIKVNKKFEQVLGYAREELIGREFKELLAPGWREEFPHLFARLKQEQALDDVEINLVTKNGWVITVSLNSRVQLDEEGRFLRTHCILTDVTAHKEAEEHKLNLQYRMQQVRKAESLGRMAGAIAHHFNNQLSVVIGHLELAISKLASDAQIRDNLFRSMGAALKASEVSKTMLAYLGQSSGKQERLDLSGVCRRSVPLLQQKLPHQVELVAELSQQGPIVNANEQQVQHILSKMVTNALEAMGDAEQGRITLRTCTVSGADLERTHLLPTGWEPKTETYACLEVADTGCGISEEDKEQIFDPFFSTKFTGRGLGLPQVLGLVKSWGGAVEVESAQHQGSVFRIYLPVVTQLEESQEVQKPKKPQSEGKILLVEDKTMVREMVATMLHHLGYTVLTAANGNEAVDIFQNHLDHIVCVLTDLSMPGMDGWQTLSAMRNIKPEIPAILASGYDQPHALSQMQDQAPQAFLQKPYKLDELRTTLERVIPRDQIGRQ